MIITEFKNKELLDTDVISYKNKKLTKVINDLNNENTYLINVLNQAFTQETKTGSDITYDNTINARFKNLKIKGNADTSTEQDIDFFGKNMLNIKNIAVKNRKVQIDSSDWITLEDKNTEKQKANYINIFFKKINLLTDTDYVIVLEVKEVDGKGSLKLISNSSLRQEGQFINHISIPLSELKNNDIQVYTVHTISSYDNNSGNYGTRTFLDMPAGLQGSITFRLSILQDTSITADKFNYEPYQGQTLPLTLPTATGEFIIENKDNNWYYNDTIITDKTLLQHLTNLSKATSYSGVTNIITTADVPVELEVTTLTK